MSEEIDGIIGDELERDSLSSDTVSRDSLSNNANGDFDCDQDFNSKKMKRQGSYTLETSPLMSESIRENKKDKIRSNNVEKKSKTSIEKQNISMTQSMYDRPWQGSRKNNSIASALAKQREEKIRLAKEEQLRKQKLKVNNFNETIKMAESVLKRRESETQRKIEEKKRKAQERQRIVDERKQRLAKAEEARKARLLEKLVNKEHRASTIVNSNNSMMTMSCYGGLGNSSSTKWNKKIRLGNKEVVARNRFMQTRPKSSTGKVIGFGSSTPRNICEDNVAHKEADSKPIQKKVPEWLRDRLDVLSRPNTARSNMAVSVIQDRNVQSADDRPFKRQTSLRSSNSNRPTLSHSKKSNKMTLSVMEFSNSNQITSLDKLSSEKKTKTPKRVINPLMTQSVHGNFAKPTKNLGPPSKMKQSKSFTRHTKIDSHIDSDSIDEENITKATKRQTPKTQTNNNNKKRISKPISKTDLSSDSLDSDNLPNIRGPPKDSTTTTQSKSTVNEPTNKSITEAEYKVKLMENRRLAREKRERERDQQMKAEREKKLAEEALLKEALEAANKRMEESSEDAQLTTSNDELTIDQEDNCLSSQMEDASTITIPDNHVSQSEIPKFEESVSIPKIREDVELKCEDTKDDNKNTDTKRRLESIMSRFKKPQNPVDDSSSDCGSVSPRRAMSPEPSEMESSIINEKAGPFKSSILQSMVNKGRLSMTTGKSATLTTGQDGGLDNGSDGGKVSPLSPSPQNLTALSSVRESIEDDSTDQAGQNNSKSSEAIRSSGIDGNSLSDANSDFAIDHSAIGNQSQISDITKIDLAESLKIDREDCDGKEDSQSMHDPLPEQTQQNIEIKQNGNKPNSTSSIDTEEDGEIKDDNDKYRKSNFIESSKDSLLMES